MAMIKSFRDLEVYQLALKEAQRIFIVTQSFPKEERYSLTAIAHKECEYLPHHFC